MLRIKTPVRASICCRKASQGRSHKRRARLGCLLRTPREELNMPKKRRGRPPGSKNKAKFGGSAAKMDVAQLSSYIASLRNALAAKVEQQRAYFERQLAAL